MAWYDGLTLEEITIALAEENGQHAPIAQDVVEWLSMEAEGAARVADQWPPERQRAMDILSLDARIAERARQPTLREVWED